MQFSKLNRAGAENVYRTFLNVEGATITTGYPVSLKPAIASCDGISGVICNAAADLLGFVGVAMKDTANNDYGLMQVNGLINSVALSAALTSVTITAGDEIMPGGMGFYSFNPVTYYSGNGAALGNFRHIYAIDTANVSTAGYTRGLINVL